VHNYAAYRAHTDSWMLGRFVVPAARLDEFSTHLDAIGEQAGPEWRLSALLSQDVDADLDRVRRFDRAHRGRACIDCLEGKLVSADAMQRAADGAGTAFAVFAEIPSDADVETLVDAAKRAGINAKIRTGGVTADVFPEPEPLLAFIEHACRENVPFKATAGLHHMMRGDYPLTYKEDSPKGTMFGFLNVFLTAAFVHAGLIDGAALALLLERDLKMLFFSSNAIGWRGRTVTTHDIRAMRDCVAMSFGSCSFREPVDELRAAALIA